MADYRQKAMEMYDPSYNIKKQGVINSTNQSIANLEGQKTGVNANYDKQVEGQNLQNTLGKNNYSNTMLGRGLGRSSIVGTGLAGLDSQNNRLVGNINFARTGDLNNIENMKTQAKNNMEGSLNSMLADRETGVMSLAQQLQQYDEEKAFKERQFQADQQYKYASLNASKSKAEKPVAEKPGKFYQQYLDLRESNPEEADKFLKQNAGDVIDRYGNDYYQGVMKEHKDYMDNYQAQQKRNSQTQEPDSEGWLSKIKRYTSSISPWW